MNIEVTSRHITVPDNIKEYAIKKVNKILRYYENPISCHIIFSNENSQNVVEINLALSGKQIFVKDESENLMQSIDSAVDKLVTRVKKFKTKLQSRH
ncbi:MAG: ribosome-associated translation inhibitor RaiA [Candidatus Marinimicrobia bacterium]|nr:ribosome-associated translation inhibitor RaiA [Candidatus Neomarinimicrobiota bacterium]